MKNFMKYISCIPEAVELSKSATIEQRLSRTSVLFDYGVRWQLNGERRVGHQHRRCGQLSSLDVSIPRSNCVPVPRQRISREKADKLIRQGVDIMCNMGKQIGYTFVELEEPIDKESELYKAIVLVVEKSYKIED